MIQINTSLKQKQIHRHREDTQGSQRGGEVQEGRAGSLRLAEAN